MCWIIGPLSGCGYKLSVMLTVPLLHSFTIEACFTYKANPATYSPKLSKPPLQTQFLIILFFIYWNKTEAMLYVDDQPSLLPQPSALLSRRRAIGGGRACCPGWCSWTGPPRTRTTSPLGPWISAARTRRTASRPRSNSRSAEIQASNVTQDTGGVEHTKLYGYD